MRTTPAIRFLATAAALCAAAVALAPAAEYLSAAEALKLAFPGSGTVERFAPQATVEQGRAVIERGKNDAQGKLGEIWVGHSSGRLDGVAIIDHVIGRTEYITYVCVIGPDGRVRRIEVMAYREAYGGEIRDRAFLAQFEGKGPADPLRRDRQITNIAGATLSVHALSERVRFLLDYHEVIVQPAVAAWLPTRAAAPAVAVPIPVERSAALGTSALNVAIHGPGTANGAAADAALARADAVDAIINQWRPESELARLNANGGVASPTLRSALTRTRTAWQTSGGRFDPTVGPLILAWKAAAEAGHPPEPAELARLRALIGFDRVTIDDVGTLVLPAGVHLDLGGIAKGIVVDACAEALAPRLAPGQRALITFGGSSQRALGAPDAAPFTIDLRDPRDAQATIARVLLRPGQGLGSSSAVGRVFTIGGERFSHLIDPTTGAPGPLDRAAWVVAPDAAVADGLDTALCLLPAAEALALVARLPGVSALLWDGERLHASPGWPAAP